MGLTASVITKCDRCKEETREPLGDRDSQDLEYWTPTNWIRLPNRKIPSNGDIFLCFNCKNDYYRFLETPPDRYNPKEINR